MKTNSLFVVDNMGLGGYQRVNVTITDYIEESAILSLSIRNPLFHGKKTIFVNRNFGKMSKLLINKLGPNNEYEKKFSFYVDEISSRIRKHSVSNCILNDKLCLLLPKLKEIHADVNFVVWLHTTGEQVLKSTFNNNEEKAKRVLKMADHVIVLSQKDAYFLSEYTDNAIVIPNPVTLSSKLKSDLTVKTIAYTGRILFSQKGVGKLVELAKSLPEDWNISVAGEGNDKTEFEELIKKEKLENKFIMRGYTSGKDLEDHYKQCSIFVSTSNWEAFGLVILEAMEFGLPVVAFRSNGAELILNDRYGIIANSTSELIQAIEKLIESPRLLDHYSEMSLKRVKDFSPENIAEIWGKIL